MSTKDIDRGWDSIKKQLKLLDKSYTKVGVQQGTKRKSDENQTGLSDMVTIAAANEFGTENIPARPSMRNALDKNLNKLKNIKRKLQSSVELGNISARRALGLLGEAMTAFIKKEIRDLKIPPNAESTLKRKYPKANPLIDKGQFIQSIDHVEVIK